MEVWKMTAPKKRILAGLILLLMPLWVLTGCSCEHEWKKATCQEPRTCIRCGETEGKIRSHEWGSTACHDLKGCVVCGTLDGIEITHEWQEDCKICVHCGYDGRTAEERFPDVLAAGLENRWQLESTLQEYEDYDLTKEDWANLFAAEYDQVSSFKTETFQDEALEALAQRYIKLLEDAQETLDLFGTDQWEDQYQNGIYWKQLVTLFEINNLRPVVVAEEYQQNLTQLLTNGEIVNMVYPLLDQIFFLHINTTAHGEQYETTVKNTTSLTFVWFSLDVNLLDENGTVLETENIKTYNWKPEEKKRFNFTTDTEFAAIDVAFANWELPRY